MRNNLQEMLYEARIAAAGATCKRASCGASAWNADGQFILSACNEHVCSDDCVLEDNHCVAVIHAEVNLVAKAARYGDMLSGSTVMLTQRPCQRCLMTLKKAGVAKVYYEKDYHSSAHGAEFVSEELMHKLSVEQYVPTEN